MSNRLYDILKWVSLVALDAIGLFYQTVATIWALPYGDEVLNTCVALSVLIGTLIGIKGMNYQSMLDSSNADEEAE